MANWRSLLKGSIGACDARSSGEQTQDRAITETVDVASGKQWLHIQQERVLLAVIERRKWRQLQSGRTRTDSRPVWSLVLYT